MYRLEALDCQIRLHWRMAGASQLKLGGLIGCDKSDNEQGWVRIKPWRDWGYSWIVFVGLRGQS